MKDPNDINYNKDSGLEKKPKDPFFDNMSHEDAPFRSNPNYRGKNPRGGRGSGRGRGRGNFINYPDAKKDAETFGENTAENFKFSHEQDAARGRGGKSRRGGDRDNRER